MNISFDCIPCIVSSFVTLLKKDHIPRDRHEEAMRQLLAFLASVDYRQSPPALGQEMHRLMREILNDPDPYRDIKKASNRMMLDEMEQLRRLVSEADDTFDAALRLAIAGNVIDYGPQERLDVWETIERVLHEKFLVDDSDSLRRALSSSEQLLYIGDNCGEIVTDKIFLERIAHPNVYFAVRGAPVKCSVQRH